MQPHQLRVITEKAELDVKLGKLEAFIGSHTFQSMNDKPEQSRLIRQAALMKGYSQVLGERIAAFR